MSVHFYNRRSRLTACGINHKTCGPGVWATLNRSWVWCLRCRGTNLFTHPWWQR